MTTTHTPPPSHVAFDALCAPLEEWEPLPTVRSIPPALEPELDPRLAAELEQDERAAPLDGLILAGLVSP